MLIQRRNFLVGLASLIAAPAIVRAASLMPVRGVIMPSNFDLLIPQGTYMMFCGRLAWISGPREISFSESGDVPDWALTN